MTDYEKNQYIIRSSRGNGKLYAMADYEKFEAVGKIRQFAANTPGMHPIGQKVRITGPQKSIDIDVAKYVQCDLKPQTIYKWLQLIKEVIAC